MSELPILPTMGVGSYAAPGWFIAAQKMIRDGEYGPGDIDELYEDALRIAVADQVEAGIDVLTDGELRRRRFVFQLYGRIEGLKRRPPRRKLGIQGYDMAPSYAADAVPAAPDGLGTVHDFEALKRLAPDRPLKVTLPGPLTFASSITPDGVPEDSVLEALCTIVRAEFDALVAAGAERVQIDEPSLSHPPYGRPPEAGARVINRVLAGLAAHRSVHVCFGNNAGRPRSDRRFGPLMDAMLALDCEQLVLEFANREMADVACLGPLSERFDIAAGVVDVKNWRLETAEDVARRIRQCLAHVPPARLCVTADCGFSALPRYLAREKMIVMAAGAARVRDAIGES